MKLGPPSPEVVAQERWEALDTVRRTMAHPGLPLASDNNPLGLPLDADGQVPTLRITAPEGEGVKARNTQCTSFCEFLNSQEGYVQAFNRLLQYKQKVAILIQEE